MTPVMELGGGKVRRSHPIAIFGRQPATNTVWKSTVRKKSVWKKISLEKNSLEKHSLKKISLEKNKEESPPFPSLVDNP